MLILPTEFSHVSSSNSSGIRINHPCSHGPTKQNTISRIIHDSTKEANVNSSNNDNLKAPSTCNIVTTTTTIPTTKTNINHHDPISGNNNNNKYKDCTSLWFQRLQTQGWWNQIRESNSSCTCIFFNFYFIFCFLLLLAAMIAFRTFVCCCFLLLYCCVWKLKKKHFVCSAKKKVPPTSSSIWFFFLDIFLLVWIHFLAKVHDEEKKGNKIFFFWKTKSFVLLFLSMYSFLCLTFLYFRHSIKKQ